MNKKIETEYHNLLPNLIQRLPIEKDVFISNNIFFKGKWNQSLNAKPIKKNFISGKKKWKVLMMKFEKKIKTIKTKKYQAIKMDYCNPMFSFIGIIPNGNKSIKDVLLLINKKDGLTKLVQSMKENVVSIEIPKFKISVEVNLNDDIVWDNYEKIVKYTYYSRIFDLRRARCPVMQQKTAFEFDDEISKNAVTTNEKKTSDKLLAINFHRPFIYFVVRNVAGKYLPVLMGRFSID